jgi:hypothetical protein
MLTLEGRRGWISRAPMRRWRRVLVAESVCVLVAGSMSVANAAPAAPRVLLVGSYQGIPGQYSSIQAAVDAARPGDWILIGPGDYHETGNRVPPGAAGDDQAGAAVLVTTPNIWIRGMDRNGVLLDGTKPGAPRCSSAQADQDFGPIGPTGTPTGRNGLIVFKASGVSVENLTACNFLEGAETPGDEIWFDGGGSTGTQQIGSWRGAFLSATSSFGGISQPVSGYGIYASNTYGPGLFTQVYANNMGDAGMYIGACPDCNSVLDHVHTQNNDQGYSGTNSGGHLIIQYSEFDHNRTGFSTNSQNNDDQPSPQSGKCPANGTGPTGTKSCWLFTHNSVHDNNNLNVPQVSSGVSRFSPMGTGVVISGGRFDTVVDNDIHNNGAFGVLLVPEVDTEKPPPIAHCRGGIGLSALSFCYYDDWGNEIADNTFSHNGFFGNPANVDIAEISNLEFPGNCFHGNVAASGTPVNAKHFQLGSKHVTTAPPFLQFFPHNICGIPDAGAGFISFPGLASLCASQFLGSCPQTPITRYPQRTTVQLMPLPPQPSMPNPCLGVPRNLWCPTNPVSQPPYPVPGSAVH